jgi:hypothetical protein
MTTAKNLLHKIVHYKQSVRALNYRYNRHKARKALVKKISARKNSLFENDEEISLLLGGRAYIHPTEIPVQKKYAEAANGPIVEIGAAFGASALLYLSASHNNPVHSIDPFIKDSMADFCASEESCRNNVMRGLKWLGKSEKLHSWTVHPLPSYEVIKNWSSPISLLFIDGDHHYEAVKKDFEDWFPKVQLNGYILIHDSRRLEGEAEEKYNRGWQGPTQLATELLQNNKVRLVEEAFSLTVWQKVQA